jgi:hypothetical protein
MKIKWKKNWKNICIERMINDITIFNYLTMTNNIIVLISTIA